MTQIKIQRFQPGQKYYTDAVIKNADPSQGCVGSFNSVFGKLIIGSFVCYTLERLDTLISEGTRKYKKFYSPANKCIVLLFEDEPGSGTYNRRYELHIANWVFQLKGCTAVGSAIILSTPQLSSSGIAFKSVMSLVEETGEITHEKYVEDLV